MAGGIAYAPMPFLMYQTTMTQQMKIRSSILLISLALLTSFVPTGTYNIGDTIKDFSLKNVNGKMVSLADYEGAKGFIIVFTCNHCPFAKRYQERMNDFDRRYSPKGFPLIAISSNDVVAVPEDSYPEMQQRAREQKYSFPYLFDSTQEVAKAFNAVKTPHAFVIFKERGKLVLKYSGAIDDNGAEPGKVKNRYVENAVEALLNGKEVPVATTKSIGCGIKWRQQ
jgi:peroxiredoxin